MPADCRDDEAARNDSSSASRDDSPRLLVVEDDPLLRELIAGSFHEQFDVEALGSVEAAETAILRTRPDLIILDLVLPGRRGETLIGWLRSRPRCQEIPVIVITGLRDDRLRLQLLAGGASDFLEKPFPLAELHARVRNWLEPTLRHASATKRSEELERRARQLETALQSRVLIEQAKAFVAADLDLDLAEAFELIRSHARSQRLPLREVAAAVVERRGWDPVGHDGPATTVRSPSARTSPVRAVSTPPTSGT